MTMNKEEIIKELDELVKELDKDFKVVKEPYNCGELVLSCCGNWICWFCNFDKYNFHINISGRHNPQEDQETIAKTGVINKFYTRAVELLTEYEPKYTVQVFPQNRGYLNVIHDFEPSKDVAYDIGWPEDRSSLTRTEFTQSEIEGLKKRDDLAIDWGKAIIKEVDDNE